MDFNAPGGDIRFWPGGVKVIDARSTYVDFPVELRVSDNIRLYGNNLYFKPGTDLNHGMAYASGSPDGPIIWGWDGIKFETRNGGSTVRAFISASGMVVGSPTDGAKGAGTINAEAFYDDGTGPIDYVFEDDYNMLSISEMRNFYQTNKHLPTIPGRDEWETNGKFSLGEIISSVWETVEVQARYIVELEERISKLEAKV
jgi:hypothetical protein